MNKLKLPDYKLDDFFDDILEGRQGAASNYLLGRVKAIKNFLLSKEEEFEKLMFSDEGNKLFNIEENNQISIPKDVKLSEFFNFSKSISKHNLIEKLVEIKLDSLFENLSSMTLSQIKEALNSISIEDALKILNKDDDLYFYMSYVDSQTMRNVYENYIVESEHSGKKGRDIYDHILLLADDGMCPYCMYGNVSTVDHYLPKAHFIDYAITPLNLLPSCYECNTTKLDKKVLEENKMFINPFCDDLTNIRWLGCDIMENTFPITFKFSVIEDIEDKILQERLKEQFKVLSLGTLYATKAARHFRIRVKSIVENFESGDLQSVIKALESDKLSAEEYNINTLESKVYESLLGSEWFLKEGIKNLRSFYLIRKKEEQMI